MRTTPYTFSFVAEILFLRRETTVGPCQSGVEMACSDTHSHTVNHPRSWILTEHRISAAVSRGFRVALQGSHGTDFDRSIIDRALTSHDCETLEIHPVITRRDTAMIAALRRARESDRLRVYCSRNAIQTTVDLPRRVISHRLRRR